jgi:hypothetical protein
MKFAQLALGASFLAGMMTAPAMAANLTGVDFGTETDFRTYRSNPLTDTETFTDGDAADAISALTDNDVLTHVELFSDSETNAYTSLGAFQTASRTTLTTVLTTAQRLPSLALMVKISSAAPLTTTTVLAI